MTNLFLDPMTIAFCAVIVCFAMAFFIKLRNNLNNIIKEIKAVNTKIVGYKYIPEIDGEGEYVESTWNPTVVSAAYQNFNNLDQFIKETGSLKSQWIEYCSSLQLPSKDFIVAQSEEPYLRNTVSPSDLFTFSNVISNKMNLRTYTSIPNILTGLGLLFTFIGLMLGISESAIGLTSGNTDTALKSLNPLLHGASIAFTTSVIGLLLSMLFSLYEKQKFHQVELQISKFSSLISARIRHVGIEDLASMQLAATINQTEALKSFYTEQQRATDETIERVCGAFRKALFDSTNNEFDKMSGFIGELNSSIQANVLLLNESQNNQQKIHEQSCETLVNLTEKVSVSLLDNLNKLEERELKRSDSIIQSFAKSIDHMESVNESNSKHIFDTLSLMNSEFESQIKHNMKLVKTSTAETISTLMVNVQNMVKENSLQFTETMKDNLSGIMDELTTDIKRSEKAINPLLSSLPEFTEKAYKVNEQMRDITQEQFVLTTNIRNTFTEVNKAGAMLNLSVDKLNATNNRTLESSNLYMDIMEAVKESVDAMQACAEDIKSSSTDMNEISASQKQINVEIETLMNNVFVKLNKNLSDYTSNINNCMDAFDSHTSKMEESMGSVFTGINGGLTEYTLKTNDYMKSLDNHTAQISAHLVEAINELKVSVDDIKRKELAI